MTDKNVKVSESQRQKDKEKAVLKALNKDMALSVLFLKAILTKIYGQMR